MHRCSSRLAGLGLVAAVFTLLVARPAAAQAEESITSYAVAIQVQPSGQIHVEEVIAYDFGDNSRHGIYRYVPVRFHYDSKYDRVYDLHSVHVSATPGTPTDVDLSDKNDNKVIRIGNPDKTITGAHTYTIDYDVEGALSSFPDHDELYWNAIGTDWTVTIAEPQARVTTPAANTALACFAGPKGANTPCASGAGKGTQQAVFVNSELPPENGLTVVVALPKGAVAKTGPVLEERWSFVRAFSLTPATVGSSVGLLLVGLALVGVLIWRKGRDRRAVGAVGGYAPADGSTDPAAAPPPPGETVPPFADRAGPVEYRPPDGLRPAQIGVLIDERADPLDITATIVDLAVRDYLIIEEQEKPHFWSSHDWNLKKLKDDDGQLLPYERDLLDSLFEDRNEVKVSELKNTFHSDLVRIEGKVYDDAVGRGWFARRPDRVRSRWLVLGWMLAIAGVAATIALAAKTHAGLVTVPIILVGLVLAAGHRWMPARTAKGSAELSHVLGFRRYVEGAEVDRMKFAEEENIFAKYLPFAIVFGATKKWARAFEGLDAQAAQSNTYWYSSPYPFQAAAFSSSIDSFANSTSGMIVSTPSGSGSGSGFGGGSGGGGGGGGGGSW